MIISDKINLNTGNIKQSTIKTAIKLIPRLGEYMSAIYEAGNNIIQKNEIIDWAINFNAIS